MARIRVDADDSAYVRLRPFHRRPELVIGLVLWTRLAWGERVALLGHELGHLRGRHMPTLVVTSTAQNLLLGVVRLLWPAGYDVSGVSELSTWRGSWGSAGGATGNQWLAAAFQRVLALPAVSLLYVMAAVEANTRQRREYAADLAAVDVAGSAGTRNLLVDLLPARGWRSVVGAAIRRGEDPWTTLGRLEPLPAREVERLRRASAATRFRVDASHPPTHLRISLVEGRPAQPAPHLVDARVRQSIDLELESYRRAFTDDVADALGNA